MDFTKNTQISSFMKIRPVGAELCHADRRRDGQTDKQTDMTMLIAAFYNFAKAPENWIYDTPGVNGCHIISLTEGFWKREGISVSSD